MSLRNPGSQSNLSRQADRHGNSIKCFFSFTKYLFSTYYMLGRVLGSGKASKWKRQVLNINIYIIIIYVYMFVLPVIPECPVFFILFI